MAKYTHTPEQNREKWKLPADYPMTAPNYARQRSKIPQAAGLGKKAVLAPAKAPPRVLEKTGLKLSAREQAVASEHNAGN